MAAGPSRVAVGADARGEALEASPANVPSRLALVVGNEGGGLTDEARGRIGRPVALPIADVESLNVAVAAGILLYTLRPATGPLGGRVTAGVAGLLQSPIGAGPHRRAFHRRSGGG